MFAKRRRSVQVMCMCSRRVVAGRLPSRMRGRVEDVARSPDEISVTKRFISTHVPHIPQAEMKCIVDVVSQRSPQTIGGSE
jgi:hypothetical protein